METVFIYQRKLERIGKVYGQGVRPQVDLKEKENRYVKDKGNKKMNEVFNDIIEDFEEQNKVSGGLEI